MERKHTRPNWLTRLTEYVRKVRRGPGRAEILCDNSGMSIAVSFNDGSVTKIRIQWPDVVSVFAFKRDVFAHDMICYGFETSEGCVEVNEGMEGWETMIDTLPTYLPGTLDKTDWWYKVVQSAFATNPTTLFTAR